VQLVGYILIKIRCLLSTLSQHVSGIIMPIFRRTKTVCYCMRCAALVLPDVIGTGCGALRCRVGALWRLLFDHVGVSCFALQVLLNQMAAVVLCSNCLRVLNWKISRACWTFTRFRFLWPCIVSKLWRERERTNKMQQSDVYYQHCLNMFRASLYPSSGEQRPCVTASGVMRWFCWMWLVAVVGRCVVGC